MYIVDPLTPHFYISKLGIYRGIHCFLIFFSKHRLWVLVRTASMGAVLTCTYNLCFEQEYEINQTVSQLKIVFLQPFKFAVYLIGVLLYCTLILHTWLSIPSVRIMKKNRKAHRDDTGSLAIPSGYAMKTRPGPV